MKEIRNKRYLMAVRGIFLALCLMTAGALRGVRIGAVTVRAAGIISEEGEEQRRTDVSGDVVYENKTAGQEGKEGKVYLGIDNTHIYENMNASFSCGYIPVCDKDTVHLAVPFTASGELKDQTLIVGLDLGEQAPFVYASYEKNVEKKQFSFGEKTVEAYLYLCDIKLEKDRVNGKYPVMVKAWGYTENGERTELEYRIFISVSDGKNPEEKEEEPYKEEDGNQEAEEKQQEPEMFMDTGDTLAGADSLAGGETEQEITRQPKLILESSSLSEERLKAGEKKEFIVSFKNKSRKEKIYNLKVTAKPAEDSVLLKNSSFYFESVAPWETIQITTEAEISPAAEQKSIPVDFTFEYEDEKGNACTGTEQTVLQVYQPVQVSVEDFYLPAQVFSLENVNAGLQIRNMGKGPVYNVQVNLEGAGLFPLGTVFAGNMEAGQTADGSMQIYVGTKTMKEPGQEEEDDNTQEDKEKYGSVAGKLILTYEDAYGKTYSQEQEFTTVIKKPQMTELKVKEEKKETNQWWAGILILVFLLCMGSMAVMGWKLKRSRNQLADVLAGKGSSRDT